MHSSSLSPVPHRGLRAFLALLAGILALVASPGWAAAQTTTTTTTTATTTSTTTTSTTTTSTGTTGANSGVAPSTYWLVGTNGTVYPLGNAPFAGSEGGQRLAAPIVGMAGVPGQKGYWLVASDGGVFTFGDAGFYGSTGAIKLNKPIVGMAATPDGHGYWLVASDGGVFTFGDAGFYGSTGAIKLNQPIVGMAPTPDGLGYYLVASDGGVFTFGDAVFHGSTGAIKLNKPIVGMALSPSGAGYWLAASDGGIFNFGDAAFDGSLGATTLKAPIVGIAAPDLPAGSQGYWLTAADGGVFNFGQAPFHGSEAGHALPAPVAGIAATLSLDPYPPDTTGYDISFPQCSGSNGASQVPSSPAPVAVVGVNGGASFENNPCLASEAAWGTQGGVLTVYMNVNSPFVNQPSEGDSGPDGNCAAADAACQAYNYGYNAGQSALAYAQSLGVSSPLWWLDVEGPAGSSNSLWSSDITANDNVISGALAALQAAGVQGGVYSTLEQWDAIAGSSYSPDVPAWRAGATDLAGAQSLCASSFTSGPTWLVQYGSPDPYDNDYAC